MHTVTVTTNQTPTIDLSALPSQSAEGQCKILANALQKMHSELKSPATQNVRNVRPMHELIRSILPILPRHDGIVTADLTEVYSVEGKQVVKTRKSTQLRHQIFGMEPYESKALTAREIRDNLRNNGYVVNSMGAIRSGIKKLGPILATVKETDAQLKERKTASVSSKKNIKNKLGIVNQRQLRYYIAAK